jgi:hypothetical protein
VRKTKEPKDSPAIALIRAVWEGSFTSRPQTWDRLNLVLRQALDLAIGAGMQFLPGDLARLRGGMFSFARWCRCPDGLYSLAVSTGNKSFIEDFEACYEQPPLIADQVESVHHFQYSHRTGSRGRERLHVGCRFPWEGEQFRVTAIGSGGARVVGDGTGRRLLITREMILENRKSGRVREKLITDLNAVFNAVDQKTGNRLLAALKKIDADTHKGMKSAPLEDLQAILAKFQPPAPEVP